MGNRLNLKQGNIMERNGVAQHKISNTADQFRSVEHSGRVPGLLSDLQLIESLRCIS